MTHFDNIRVNDHKHKNERDFISFVLVSAELMMVMNFAETAKVNNCQY
ncbi:Uncharacterised protein [Escherichia coli]|nr:Uncharacterised protein [Escherichia coli]